MLKSEIITNFKVHSGHFEVVVSKSALRTDVNVCRDGGQMPVYNMDQVKALRDALTAAIEWGALNA